MSSEVLIPLGLAVGSLGVTLVLFLVFYPKLMVKVDQGQALVVNKAARIDVYFTSALVIPLVHRAEIIDIRLRTIPIVRKGKEGLICRDNIRADVEVQFHLRVNKTCEDVLKVAQSVGAARATDPEVLEELFAAKFSEALKTVAKQLDFAELYTRREDFKDQVLQVVGADLDGYCLDDVSVDYIEQTPIEQLDPNNILDADGIRKVTELSSRARIETARLNKEMHKELARLEAECKELLIELEEQRADALAKLRRTTGRDLTEADLEAHLVERLRQMVDKVVTERLAKV